MRERFFVAWFTGAAVGLGALALEWALFGWWPGPAAVGAYTLLGGLLAAGGRSVFAGTLAAHPARLATMLGLSCFAALELLYFVNVRLLPAEHYLSWRSLAADAGAILLVGLPLLGVAHSARAHHARVRFARPFAVLGATALVASALATAWAGFGHHPAAPTASRAPGEIDVLVVVLDSVRRDRSVGAAGDSLMPSTRALEREGRAFTNGFSASSWTAPSVAAMLGSGPRPGAQPPIAEEMARAGWRTACFTDNPHLWAGSELLRGFSHVSRSVGVWRDPVRGTALGEVIERLLPGDDTRLVDGVLRWLARSREPVFLYVHLMDAHAPYRFPRGDGRRARGRRIEYPVSGMRTTDEEAEDIRARYDAGVRRADAQAGRLVAAMRERGRPFLAVVTADHGESLGESGRWFHGFTLAPELVGVPLVVLGAQTQPGRVDAAASNAELGDTVRAAAGLAASGAGESDLRRTPGGSVRGGLPPWLAYRVAGRFKVIVDRRAGTRRLFDIAADPLEKRDLVAEYPALAVSLADGLAPGDEAGAPPAEAIERLRALGYAAP